MSSAALPNSVLGDVLAEFPGLRSQIYFKNSLTALSHAMEDLVLSGAEDEQPIVVACFQKERFYRQEAKRYERIGRKSPHVFVLASPETDLIASPSNHEAIPFTPDDALANEWHLVILGDNYAACLICAERRETSETAATGKKSALTESPIESRTRRFEGIWTFDRKITCQSALILLERIIHYRPDLKERLTPLITAIPESVAKPFSHRDPEPFAQRLMTYLQTGQNKLTKAYQNIANKERRERLINSISSTIRQSLNPDEVLVIATKELSKALRVCRCLVYRCQVGDETTEIVHEALAANVPALAGNSWMLKDNPLFQAIAQDDVTAVAIADTACDERLLEPADNLAQQVAQQWNITSWLLVPVRYRDKFLGVIELHHCGSFTHTWSQDEVSLVEAVAVQLGGALLQAQAYADLENFSEQLEVLNQTRSNLIAITGHELRTPLSTIRVCLESLASEPDMAQELRQIMLETALDDADRMRYLVQDFLTLSRLESGRVPWNLEPLSVQECVDLALSGIYTRLDASVRPAIILKIPAHLSPIESDGEWLVEVLSKLLDNACKFTPNDGKIVVTAYEVDDNNLQITIADTGRGIEENQLEAVFDRFYQAEGSLRRTVGGTGLGLAICRQIMKGLGGRVWAESEGRECGSEFHLLVPIADEIIPAITSDSAPVSDSTVSLSREAIRAKYRKIVQST
ncbi:MAG: DICT sensory domain-containing protein [Cyanophyceae cyanobacterium]